MADMSTSCIHEGAHGTIRACSFRILPLSHPLAELNLGKLWGVGIHGEVLLWEVHFKEENA